MPSDASPVKARVRPETGPAGSETEMYGLTLRLAGIRLPAPFDSRGTAGAPRGGHDADRHDRPSGSELRYARLRTCPAHAGAGRLRRDDGEVGHGRSLEGHATTRHPHARIHGDRLRPSGVGSLRREGRTALVAALRRTGQA